MKTIKLLTLLSISTSVVSSAILQDRKTDIYKQLQKIGKTHGLEHDLIENLLDCPSYPALKGVSFTSDFCWSCAILIPQSVASCNYTDINSESFKSCLCSRERAVRQHIEQCSGCLELVTGGSITKITNPVKDEDKIKYLPVEIRQKLNNIIDLANKLCTSLEPQSTLTSLTSSRSSLSSLSPTLSSSASLVRTIFETPSFSKGLHAFNYKEEKIQLFKESEPSTTSFPEENEEWEDDIYHQSTKPYKWELLARMEKQKRGWSSSTKSLKFPYSSVLYSKKVGYVPYVLTYTVTAPTKSKATEKPYDDYNYSKEPKRTSWYSYPDQEEEEEEYENYSSAYFYSSLSTRKTAYKTESKYHYPESAEQTYPDEEGYEDDWSDEEDAEKYWAPSGSISSFTSVWVPKTTKYVAFKETEKLATKIKPKIKSVTSSKAEILTYIITVYIPEDDPLVFSQASFFSSKSYGEVTITPILSKSSNYTFTNFPVPTSLSAEETATEILQTSESDDSINLISSTLQPIESFETITPAVETLETEAIITNTNISFFSIETVEPILETTTQKTLQNFSVSSFPSEVYNDTLKSTSLESFVTELQTASTFLNVSTTETSAVIETATLVSEPSVVLDIYNNTTFTALATETAASSLLFQESVVQIVSNSSSSTEPTTVQEYVVEDTTSTSTEEPEIDSFVTLEEPAIFTQNGTVIVYVTSEYFVEALPSSTSSEEPIFSILPVTTLEEEQSTIEATSTSVQSIEPVVTHMNSTSETVVEPESTSSFEDGVSEIESILEESSAGIISTSEVFTNLTTKELIVETVPISTTEESVVEVVSTSEVIVIEPETTSSEEPLFSILPITLSEESSTQSSTSIEEISIIEVLSTSTEFVFENVSTSEVSVVEPEITTSELPSVEIISTSEVSTTEEMPISSSEESVTDVAFTTLKEPVVEILSTTTPEESTTEIVSVVTSEEPVIEVVSTLPEETISSVEVVISSTSEEPLTESSTTKDELVTQIIPVTSSEEPIASTTLSETSSSHIEETSIALPYVSPNYTTQSIPPATTTEEPIIEIVSVETTTSTTEEPSSFSSEISVAQTQSSSPDDSVVDISSVTISESSTIFDTTVDKLIEETVIAIPEIIDSTFSSEPIVTSTTSEISSSSQEINRQSFMVVKTYTARYVKSQTKIMELIANTLDESLADPTPPVEEVTVEVTSTILEPFSNPQTSSEKEIISTTFESPNSTFTSSTSFTSEPVTSSDYHSVFSSSILVANYSTSEVVTTSSTEEPVADKYIASIEEIASFSTAETSPEYLSSSFVESKKEITSISDLTSLIPPTFSTVVLASESATKLNDSIEIPITSTPTVSETISTSIPYSSSSLHLFSSSGNVAIPLSESSKFTDKLPSSVD